MRRPSPPCSLSALPRSCLSFSAFAQAILVRPTCRRFWHVDCDPEPWSGFRVLPQRAKRWKSGGFSIQTGPKNEYDSLAKSCKENRFRKLQSLCRHWHTYGSHARRRGRLNAELRVFKYQAIPWLDPQSFRSQQKRIRRRLRVHIVFRAHYGFKPVQQIHRGK
jgi:hypothetical protein